MVKIRRRVMLRVSSLIDMFREEQRHHMLGMQLRRRLGVFIQWRRKM